MSSIHPKIQEQQNRNDTKATASTKHTTSTDLVNMESAGSSKRTTVYVAGFAPQVNEQQLLDAFVTFGDILEISVPNEEGGGEYCKGRGIGVADGDGAMRRVGGIEMDGWARHGQMVMVAVRMEMQMELWMVLVAPARFVLDMPSPRC
jgi:hypothetical protein